MGEAREHQGHWGMAAARTAVRPSTAADVTVQKPSGTLLSMGIFRFMLESAGRIAVVIGLVGLLAGAANGALIAVVHRAISRPEAVDRNLALIFMGLALARIVLNFATGSLLANYAQESITRLRNRIVRGVLAVDLRSFERIGEARILTALTQDARSIGSALQSLPTLVINMAMAAGGACYLLYLSPMLFGMFGAAAMVGVAAGIVVRRSGAELMRKARDEYDRLFTHLRTLTGGVKELKLHALRREEFLDGGIVATSENLMAYRVRAQTRFLELNAINSTLFLMVIGSVLFWLPVEATPTVVSGYILTMLYIMGPSAGLIRATNVLTAAGIALQRIEDIGVALAAGPQESPVRGPGPASFDSVQLENITFEYGGDDKFALGPVDLKLRPGSLTLITGPNGSGKSTLARLLTGLYAPHSGVIRWNGQPVEAANRDAYRQLFSTVFYDFHLFDMLWGLGGADLDDRTNRWLDELGLKDTVRVHDGQLSTTEVSSGQRRRLALMSALLEDRAIYVFDEIGADQDAEFRDFLHNRLITELIARGKCVVVITHDPQHWSGADYHLRLDGHKSIGSGDGSALAATHADPQG